MPLIDDLSAPLDLRDASRRRFLAWLATGALGASAAGLAAGTFQFLWPSVEFKEERRIDVGEVADIPDDSVLVIPEQQIYVVRTAGKVFALSAVCTHLGCATRYERSTSTFFCPCHGSRFDRDGSVVAGPAPRALRRLAVMLDEGRIIVDAAELVGDDAILEVV